MCTVRRSGGCTSCASTGKQCTLLMGTSPSTSLPSPSFLSLFPSPSIYSLSISSQFISSPRGLRQFRMEEVPIPPGQVLVKDAPREEVLRYLSCSPILSLPLLFFFCFPVLCLASCFPLHSFALLPHSSFTFPYFALLPLISLYFASLCFPFYIIMHSILIPVTTSHTVL